MPPNASAPKLTPPPQPVSPDAPSQFASSLEGNAQGAAATLFSKQSNLNPSGISMLTSGSEQTKKLMLGT